MMFFAQFLDIRKILLKNGQIWSNFAIKADNGNMKIASIEPDKIFKSSYNEF